MVIGWVVYHFQHQHDPRLRPTLPPGILSDQLSTNRHFLCGFTFLHPLVFNLLFIYHHSTVYCYTNPAVLTCYLLVIPVYQHYKLYWVSTRRTPHPLQNAERGETLNIPCSVWKDIFNADTHDMHDVFISWIKSFHVFLFLLSLAYKFITYIYNGHWNSQQLPPLKFYLTNLFLCL